MSKTNTAKDNFTTHGLSKTPLYKVFGGMKERCYNENSIHFKHYGGRGITICEEWLENFQSFYDWAYQSGYQKDLTIDRKNVDQSYCPENCRWITQQEQSLNRQNTVYIIIDNNKTPLITFLRENNREDEYYTIMERIRKGMPPEDAVKLKIGKTEVFKYNFKAAVEQNIDLLRGKTFSLTALAKQLNISKATLIKWYRNDIEIVSFLQDKNINIK